MTRIEIWVALAFVVIFGNAAFYVLGRWQGEKALIADQAVADRKATADILDRALKIREADDHGQDMFTALMARMNQGLTDVNAKFAKIPNVVVDAKGCPDIGPSFRVRFDAASDLSAGHTERPPGFSGAVSADTVPSPD